MKIKQKFIKEIQKQKREILQNKRSDFNFLGFVENKDLPDEIMGFFENYINGRMYYNWIDGNPDFQNFLAGVKCVDKITQKEIKEILKL